MFTGEQQDFYHRWLQKADLIEGDDIAHLIDKYISLFIIYNFLYSVVPAEKAKREGGKRKSVSDRKGATVVMVSFVGAEHMCNHLETEGLDVIMEELTNAMPHFNIVLDDGRPRKRQDERLISDFASDDAEIKMLAVTKILYHIRCNIVHGEKGLYQYQQLLLLPAISLLRAIVVYLHDKLLEVD